MGYQTAGQQKSKCLGAMIPKEIERVVDLIGCCPCWALLEVLQPGLNVTDLLKLRNCGWLCRSLSCLRQGSTQKATWRAIWRTGPNVATPCDMPKKNSSGV